MWVWKDTLGGGRAESSQGPKKGGERRKTAGGRVIGKDWSPEKQREDRGVRKAEIHWGGGRGWGWVGGGFGGWIVEGRGDGLGGSMLQICPLSLCPSTCNFAFTKFSPEGR